MVFELQLLTAFMADRRLGVMLQQARSRSCTQYCLVCLLHGTLHRLLPRPPVVRNSS